MVFFDEGVRVTGVALVGSPEEAFVDREELVGFLWYGRDVMREDLSKTGKA